MTIQDKQEYLIKDYLHDKINNSWYANAYIDYGIMGKFLNCKIIDNDLIIMWEEQGEKLITTIHWFRDYTPEQIYNIWMESEWIEE